MSSILCPIDFSDASLNAIPFAAEIAMRYNVKLTLANIFTEEDYNRIVGEEEIDLAFHEKLKLIREKLEALSNEVLEKYNRSNKLQVACDVVTGEFEYSLLEYAEESDARMIVMGSVGLGGSGLMGSHALAIVHRSTKPVLCVPQNSKYSGFDRIVFASEVSEDTKLFLQEVIDFSVVFDSRIYVVHIPGMKRELVENFFNKLKTFISYQKMSFEVYESDEHIGEGLLTYMREKESSLLVMYSRQRSFFENLVHVSLPEEMALISNRPILVLK